MPEDGAFFRGKAVATLSSMQQDLMLDNSFLSLIQTAKDQDLNNYEQAIIRVLDRDILKYQKVPKQLIEKLELTTNQAQIAWRNARKNNDFRLFAPHLEKIIDLSKQKAEHIGYKNHPYNGLLDEYEQDLTTTKLDKFFTEIELPLKNLLEYIKKSDKYIESHPLETFNYSKYAMQELNAKILKYFNADLKKLRLDESTHPFTESISVDDVRITTRYAESDFADSLTATVHEYGHALYELQIDRNLTATPLEGGVSL